MIRYVLDTHAIVWAIGAPKKLGTKARQVIEYAAPGQLGISAASVMEIGRLLNEDAFDLGGMRPTDFLAPFFAQGPQIPVSINAALRAPVLALKQGDPYDRIIVATALELGVPLITKDGNITDSGLVRVLW